MVVYWIVSCSMSWRQTGEDGLFRGPLITNYFDVNSFM